MSNWSMADLIAAEHRLVPQEWQVAAADRRSQSRMMFEDATNYAAAGGSAVQAWHDPAYRSDLPDVPVPAAPPSDVAMNQSAADSFVSQPSQQPGGMILRCLRLLFHKLLQLLRRRGLTDPAASADAAVSHTDEGPILDDLQAITESELLHAARTFAASGQALFTPIPTSPVAVPRRRR